MKKIFKVFLLLMLCLLVIDSSAMAETNSVNIYEESSKEEVIFEFEKENINISNVTELKLNTNLEVNANDIAWSISDDTVAKLEGGILTPLKSGVVEVEARYLPLEIKATCKVNVEFIVEKTNIKVEANTYTSLKITYDKVVNATHYEIQRATKANGRYEVVATTTDTNYVDNGLNCGNTYYYKVRAVNKENGIMGEESSVVSLTVQPEKTVITTKTANSYNSTYIKWNKVSGTSGYRVYRATSENGKYTRCITTSSTSYTDKNLKPGTTYYYLVRAYRWVNDKMVFGDYCDSFSITPKLEIAKTVITTKAANSYNSTYIKWNKVSGASGYRVYRATSENGKYTRCITTSATSYTDKNLNPGTTYYYLVRAYRWVNGKMVFGDYCDSFTITPKLEVPNIEVKQSGIGVKVNISKANNPTGYIIYRSGENGDYTKIATTSNLSYKDCGIIFTSSYYYKVRAYKTVGKTTYYSEYTKPQLINTYVPRPTIRVERTDTREINISWDKLAGSTGYEIYVSEDGNNFTLLKDITSYQTDNYTKSGLELDKTYYIKARTYIILNGEKIYSAYSNVESCTIDEFMIALKLKSNYNVRSAPSSNHKVVGTVKRDQIVVSYGRVANYYKVKVNGKFGYIHKNYLTAYNDAKVIGLSNINQFSYQGGAPLPMGCEVTSLAVVLQYLGFNKVTKNMLADKYQPRGAVGATDPNVAFVGTPYSSRPYGCYAPVIVKTAQNYFKAIGNDEYQVNNLTGLNINEIYKEIDKGNPLVMWITYGRPYKQESWTLRYGTKTTKAGSGTYRFTWYGMQHCVAVAGYNKKKNTLIIADVGTSGELTEYSISYLTQGYNVLGKQLVSITKK